MHFRYKGIMRVTVQIINITLSLLFAAQVYAFGKFVFNSHIVVIEHVCQFLKCVNVVTVGPSAYRLVFGFKKIVYCLLKKYIQFLNSLDFNALTCKRLFQIIVFFF